MPNGRLHYSAAREILEEEISRAKVTAPEPIGIVLEHRGKLYFARIDLAKTVYVYKTPYDERTENIMPAIFRLLKRRELERIAIGNDPRINAAVRDSLP